MSDSGNLAAAAGGPSDSSSSWVALCFDEEQHMQHRRNADCPILGMPLGTLPSNPQQNSQLGMPFAYSAAQVAALQQATTSPDDPVKSIELPPPRTARERLERAVVLDLSQRGYFVLGGARHGFDFVVYEGDPVRHHGSMFVVLVEEDQELLPRELVLWNRLAATAHKSVLLASMGEADLEPTYVDLQGLDHSRAQTTSDPPNT